MAVNKKFLLYSARSLGLIIQAEKTIHITVMSQFALSEGQEVFFPLSEGFLFDSLKQFKDALHAWSIADHFGYRITHSDRQRVMVKCRLDQNCPFYVRCNYLSRSDQAVVSKVTSEHSCLGHAPVLRAPASGSLGYFGRCPGS